MSDPTGKFCNETEESSSSKHSFDKMLTEIVASLPKEERWTDELDMYKYQGFWYHYCFLGGIILAQQHFKPEAGDIVLCTYPKTGMTWLKALAFSIATRNRFDTGAGAGAGAGTSPLLTTLPQECVPFLEIDFVRNGFVRDKQIVPNLFATHIPYASLPKTDKMVYIYRDPKDTFVSLWHFQEKFIGNIGETKRKQRLCFETELERFCGGKSLNGPFWDHVLGYWNASLENPEKLLFLKFNDLKKDGVYWIKKLADFMNQPFSEEEEKENVAKKIMELCSFENLSNLEVNKTGYYSPQPGVGIQNNAFFRKGVVGDWENHLTKEMADRIDAITQHKFGIHLASHLSD